MAQEEARDSGQTWGGTWHGNHAWKGYSQETDVMGFVWLLRDNCLQRAGGQASPPAGLLLQWLCRAGWGKGTEVERSTGGRVNEAC